MTEKELRKLKRRDFLQLLLAQSKDMAAAQAALEDAQRDLEQVQETDVRLKAKLDEKDELIEKLKGRLDNKDETIKELRQEIEDMKARRKIELEQAGSIAMASLSLNGIFETAQKAADQYLYNIHLMYNELASKCGAETPAEEPAQPPAEAEPKEQTLPEEEQAPAPDTAEKKETEDTDLENDYFEFLRRLESK